MSRRKRYTLVAQYTHTCKGKEVSAEKQLQRLNEEVA